LPEGHTLHRLAAELTRTFGGRRVASSSPQGRFTAATRLDGGVLRDAEAWGKHLFVRFDDLDEQVHIHLGIYGTLRFMPGAQPVIGQVRWRVFDGVTTADLRGPNACDLLTPPETEAILARLGPDPLRSDADPEAFVDRVLRSRAPIATLLMDQSVIAGVGNIYRAETLFRLRVDPFTPGNELDRDQAELLWTDLRALMTVGVERGRIDTVLPEHEPEAMGRPPRQDDHGGEVYVYRRHEQPCWVCGAEICTRIVANRNVFWCPRCQTS